MTSSLFQFGETRPEYAVPVLNERAVRAGAGILFLFAIVSFMQAWQLGNFQPTRVFVIAFLIDFTLRIFVNPRYAPSLILGQWFVRKQQADYVGAPQKRFAWAIGFVLALVMFYLLVLNAVVGPINLLICAICLTLLFFESAFGICVGCKVYNVFNKEQAQLCPGGVREVAAGVHHPVSWAQSVVLVIFLLGVIATSQQVGLTGAAAGMHDRGRPSAILPAPTLDAAEAERCKVPEFAKAMGHEDKWRMHNNCQ